MLRKIVVIAKRKDISVDYAETNLNETAKVNWNGRQF